MPSVNMVKGVEFSMGWRFKTDPVTPKNLTGYKVLVQIRPTKDSEDVIISFDETSSSITFTPLNGAVDLLIPAQVVAPLNFKKGFIDCWVYNSYTDGERSPTYEVIFDKGVSRL